MPTGRTVPEGGVYAKAPGTFAVASNCVDPSAVPETMLAGVAQAITGVAFEMVSCWLLSLLAAKPLAGL